MFCREAPLSLAKQESMVEPFPESQEERPRGQERLPEAKGENRLAVKSTREGPWRQAGQ